MVLDGYTELTMAVHIVSPQDYKQWNSFLDDRLHALCGTTIRVESGPSLAAWTEKPCSTNPDKVCPKCRENPEYALILLSGEEVLY